MIIISSIKRVVRKIVPSRYGWRGDYINWHDANSQCLGYDQSNIVEKVLDATLKVKNGEAVYERDSVLFNRVEYSWPLLSTLMWVAAINKGKINVIDFGGSLGSSYFQNKKFLDTLEVKWNIIEQESFVKYGQDFIEDGRLNFFYSVEEAISRNEFPDLLIIACTLPYLQQPYDSLIGLLKHNIPYIIIDNTPFNYEPRDRITVQKVSPAIYKASYACWFLDYNKVVQTVTEFYTIVSEHENDSYIFLDGRKINYKGFLAKFNSAEK